MTISEFINLAYNYAESLRDVPISSDMHKDILTFYKQHGGLEENYYDFVALANITVKNNTDIKLSDAYLGAPEWV